MEWKQNLSLYRIKSLPCRFRKDSKTKYFNFSTTIYSFEKRLKSSRTLIAFSTSSVVGFLIISSSSPSSSSSFSSSSWAPVTSAIISAVVSLLSKSYSLVAIINHSGKLNAGHYTATIREKGSTNWLSCNEKSVLPTDLNKFDYSLPYVLFFTKS